MIGGAAAAVLAPPLLARERGAWLDGVQVVPDREAMVPVPGGRAYVRVNGDLAGPRPPIVMIHGGPGSSHWYFINATALANERAVILYDQLDSGRSESPNDPANWNVARFVDELEAIRAFLEVPRWHVAGGSWGATVALEYGARRPRELAALVLQSPLVATESWLRDARLLKRGMPASARALLDICDTPGAAPKADCDAATRAFYARYVQLRNPPVPMVGYLKAQPRSFSPEIYNHMWGRAEFTATGSLQRYDGRPLLAKLDGERTLFVAGQHDEARPETVKSFARMVPSGADFVEIPDAAHSILIDNPAAYVKVLRKWLAERDA
jgi:proline iminopeptidase/L-proline amide hydrolase